MFGFWILRPEDISTPGTVFPCTVGARVEHYHYLQMHHIYIQIHTNMCMNTRHWLNQAAAGAEGFFANQRMVHCLLPILRTMMIMKVLIIVHCLVPVPIAIMIIKYWCRYGFTSIITSSTNNNIHSTVNNKYDNDSNHGKNQKNMKKHNNISKTNSNTNSNRKSGSNNNSNHDSSTNRTSKRNSTKTQTIIPAQTPNSMGRNTWAEYLQALLLARYFVLITVAHMPHYL